MFLEKMKHSETPIHLNVKTDSIALDFVTGRRLDNIVQPKLPFRVHHLITDV